MNEPSSDASDQCAVLRVASVAEARVEREHDVEWRVRFVIEHARLDECRGDAEIGRPMTAMLDKRTALLDSHALHTTHGESIEHLPGARTEVEQAHTRLELNRVGDIGGRIVP